MIRELLFSWETWVIWYGTTAFVWTARHLHKGKKTDTFAGWERISAYPEPEQLTQDIPRAQKISLNVESDPPTVLRGEVINIRSRPEKPDWMR